MADDTRIYIAIVEGQRRLYRHTDPRLVRKHILSDWKPPEIDVRIPTTEEAMDCALDGIKIVDLTPKETEEDLLKQLIATKKPAVEQSITSDGEGVVVNDKVIVGDDGGEAYDTATGEVLDADRQREDRDERSVLVKEDEIERNPGLSAPRYDPDDKTDPMHPDYDPFADND